jgi:Abortive infection C-terminus
VPGYRVPVGCRREHGDNLASDMANYLDFLVAFDDHIRESSLGFIIYGHELYGIAQRAGLVAAGDDSPARWAGELVADGCIAHGPPGLGDQHPTPTGAYTSYDMSRFSDWRVTPTGRAEADRVRGQRRAALTDIALGGSLPDLRGAVTEPERPAITGPFSHLRSALDAGRNADAVGAAKELAEAACKLVLQRAGEKVPGRPDLPALYKLAAVTRQDPEPASDLGRSLAVTVQRLAELRNDVGAGHGHATQPRVGSRDARLAATAGCGLALFLLSTDEP